ncbi:MAG: thiol:disulfide interchange protein DsbA/DsbL [Gammaproteobacteria bacterium]|nr:thiol:disulfide interchange protein DsbA/DsbL [Gammaproteobacteria bacterium]NIR84607.1 thiol:disulfide interchange protein DsbA/DsbL [Gammaproteobacteria bacterium]NIR90510.1 thiol:disulfide interchange protein DsbA/DsbL [Gammaproteobacteria bacterium]NIU05658.1 thiol:disulfide interchange protein DsbA/DsbL [Gammaproteobacteria bacterium]NIV52797.1 thioredoxin domain-containing protein [Gammaproteobacteria bacterium]
MTLKNSAVWLVLLVAGIGFDGPVTAAQHGEVDIAGKYERVQPPQPTQTEPQVEVLDVFWYGCPHCYDFLPHMERWEENKPEYASVRRMPAVFRKSWVAHAKAYYTAKLLGVADEIHRPLFEEIHEKGRRMVNKADLMAFFKRFGVSEQDFLDTFDSFAVQSNVQRAITMQDRYGVMGTPTVIVNGKYRVSGSLAGSYPNMVQVIDELVRREHEATMAYQ